MDDASAMDGSNLSRAERAAIVNNQWAYVEGMLDNAISRAQVARSLAECTSVRRKNRIHGMCMQLLTLLSQTSTFELRDQP